MRPRIGRIDELVRHLGDAVLADHRLQEALGIVHIVEAEAALDAEPVLVGRAVATAHIEELVVLDVIGELAADAAIRTDAVDLAVGLGGEDVALVHQRRRHQRAGRAGLHAFAAGNAGRVAHRVVEVEHDLGVVAAAGHPNDVVDLHLAAGADAEIAMDAGIEIDRHSGMAAVGRRTRVAREAAGLDVLALDDLPELGIRIVRDLERRLIVEQELGHHAARGLGTIGLRLHLHAGRRHADAACGEHALALDLHHADAAVAVRPIAGLGRVAQVRQLDPEPARSAENRLAGADVDLAVVDGEGFCFVDAHGFTPNSSAASSVLPGNTSARIGADLAPPDQARRSRHRASGPRARSTAPRSTAPAPSASQPS